jgi:vacuolar-type H+-ATPase subunit E/Vma4
MRVGVEVVAFSVLLSAVFGGAIVQLARRHAKRIRDKAEREALAIHEDATARARKLVRTALQVAMRLEIDRDR